jgi:hypothetical protein
LRSKITFINFWFASCAPCVAEFQALEKFYNQINPWKTLNLFLSLFEADSVIERVKKTNNLTYPIYAYRVIVAEK